MHEQKNENHFCRLEIHLQRSAYTHRSHGTIKSKASSLVPPGALLIAPDGEVITVGGPIGYNDGEFLESTAQFTKLFFEKSS